MRQSLGTAVLFGMLGVTCFGLLFTPAFYTFIRKLGRKEWPAWWLTPSTWLYEFTRASRVNQDLP